jgi:hypothetical protein
VKECSDDLDDERREVQVKLRDDEEEVSNLATTDRAVPVRARRLVTNASGQIAIPILSLNLND